MSKDSEIYCCVRCGRDTKAKNGICAFCSGKTIKTKVGDMRGVKCRATDFLTLDEEPEEETSMSRYHGDNIRDDT